MSRYVSAAVSHFPFIWQSRVATPSKCNPMLAYLGDVVGWLANQRLGDCNCRLIPERPPCQLKCFSPLDLLSEIAVISHVELDPKLEKGRRHFLPLSQTKAKRLRWRPLHKVSCGLIVHCGWESSALAPVAPKNGKRIEKVKPPLSSRSGKEEADPCSK
jgi:hypothetical protein